MAFDRKASLLAEAAEMAMNHPSKDARAFACEVNDYLASPAGAAVEPSDATIESPAFYAAWDRWCHDGSKNYHDFRAGYGAALSQSVQPQAEPSSTQKGAAGQEQAGVVADLDIERLGTPTMESELRFVHENILPDYSPHYKGSTLWRRIETALAAPGAAIAVREQFKEVQPDGAITAVDPEDIAAREQESKS